MLIPRSENSWKVLAEALGNRQVLAMACDTIYGLVGAAPATEKAIRRIKGRDEKKPLLMLIGGPETLPDIGVRIPGSPILSLWPGPFTFVFPRIAGGTVAVRVPEDPRLRRIIDEVGKPLFSTSVNRSGEPQMDDPAEIERKFGRSLALVEDSGVLDKNLPSTVVDLSIRPFRILRQGAGQVPQEYLF